MDKKRFHPSVIIENVFSCFWLFLLLFLSILHELLLSFIENSSKVIESISFLQLDTIKFIIGIVILFFLLAILVLFFFVKWYYTYYSLTDEMLIIETGKWNHKVMNIKLSNIANINYKKNLFQRLIHTSRLKIELNSMDDDISFTKMILVDQEAIAFKNKILKRVEPEKTKKDSFVSFTYKDVIKHNLYNLDFPTMIMVLLIYSPIVYSFVQNLEEKSNWVIFVLTLLFVVPFLWNFISKLFDYQDFYINRDKNQLHLSYGLFTKVSYQIPIHRIHAIIIKQSLQARIAKKYMIEIINAGLGNEKNEKKLIALYVDEKIKDEILKQLLPEFTISGKIYQQDPKTYPLYICSMWFFALIVLLVSVWFSYWFFLCFCLFPVIVYFKHKTHTLILYDQKVMVGRGIFE